MERENFKLKLLKQAKKQVRTSNCQFDNNVENSLIELISNGVDRMTSEEYSSSEKRRQVEQNLETLVKHMMIIKPQKTLRFKRGDIIQSRNLNESIDINLNESIDINLNESIDINLNESIDMRAFGSVRLSICPLWPFC